MRVIRDASAEYTLARIEYEFKMKKIENILFAIPLFAMLLVACDPIVDEISPDPNGLHWKILLLNLCQEPGKQQHSDCSYSVTLCEGL